MTGEEALADDDIWRVTEDSEEDGSDSGKEDYYNAKERNKMYYENPDLLYNEETEMAKYMIERAPDSGM